MSYNKTKTLSYLDTAGKVTVVTTLLGVFVFVVVFLLNLGNQEFKSVEAQGNATTTITVLNTPPTWTVNAHEVIESATTSPTNSGDNITWAAIGTDSNNADYQLLICDGNASPTPGTSTTSPACGGTDTQWAVSATTTSGTEATAATTTTEAAPFAERQLWYGWICDSIDLNARCNTAPTTGIAASNSSPFHVNSRPLFSSFTDDSPADPGADVIFTSVSSDPDSIGGNDTLQLVVCSTSSYNGATNACGNAVRATLATSTFVTANATGTYTVIIPTQDTDYTAFGYVVDEHGHESTGIAQATDSTLSVNNVPPEVTASLISINNGNDMILTNEAGETPNFSLEFTTSDDNSCENAAAGDEVTGYVVSLYREGIGSSTCDGITGTYNANNCYIDNATTSHWALSCAATTTLNDCNFPNDAIDVTRIFTCDFPLWYVADPTDGTATSTQYSTENWYAEVRAIDDDNATGTPSETPRSASSTLQSLLAFNLSTLAIPYGSLEPGANTLTLSATTTLQATGNIGLDETLQGQSMCGTYTTASPCPASSSSTIPASEQEFATSSLAYGSGISLASTSATELELNVAKTTSTSTPASAITYWGIAVPVAISLAGIYTGETTFYGVTGESVDW